MEFVVLGLFAAMLTGCVVCGVSLVVALLGGYLLFFGYALHKGLAPKKVLALSLQGVFTIRNILITFLLIGMLTGLWRASGTIATIVWYSFALIRPSVMLLLAFLLNCLVSVLTGTAFGTAATMGTICMTMSLTMNLNPLFTGGAILAGAYFGDRCSPVSTSALLVSELTGTNIFNNIRLMLKSAAVPFAASCLLYLALGRVSGGEGVPGSQMLALFEQQFQLGILPLIPAILILVLAVCKVNVKASMAISILSAAAICLLWQGQPLPTVLHTAVFGYKAPLAPLAAVLNGGGVVSMVRTTLIVCISSCYAGIFEATGLLTPIQKAIQRAAQKASIFAVMIPLSTLVGMVACNQTLTIMLTNQLCAPFEEDKQTFAIHLANSAVVIAALIPWSIAGAVPLSSCNAPAGARFFAFFLYLLPLWWAAVGQHSRKS